MKSLNPAYAIGFSLLAGYACNTGNQQNTSNKTDSTDQQPPNVIIFLADDLGYNDLSCYREANAPQADQPPSCQTPNLDKLAQQGMRFTDFYCGAAVSSPSRSALITGRNKTRVGIYNWIPPNSPMHLRKEEVTIAEILKQVDYKTGHFGKWHLTSEGMGQPIPNDQGFDYSFFAYNNARPSHKDPINYFKNGEPVGELKGYACQLVVDEAINWLKTNKTDNQPFYINVWFNEPHEKVAAPDSLKQRHQYREAYYGAIENMDNAAGRLLTFIEEQGWDNNTIIIFSSDNGSEKSCSNDPLRGEKCFNYEGGLRVPFIIRYPGQVPANQINTTPGGFVDVLPTLAEFTNTKLPEGRTIDGISLAQLMTDKTDKIERKHPLFFYRYFHEPICMLRDGDWCLLGYQDTTEMAYAEDLDQGQLAKFKPDAGEPSWSQWGFQESHMEAIPEQDPVHFELYNLREDKEQHNNLADKHPDRMESMKQQMLSLRKEMIAEGGNWFEQ